MKKRIAVILILAVLLTSFCALTACSEPNCDLDEVVLTDELVGELQQAYAADEPVSNSDALTIRFCLGSVNGKIVVSFEVDTPDFCVVALGGQIAGLPYERMYPLRVYTDGKLLLLPNAYDQGLVTQSELEKILAAFWGTDDWTYVKQHYDDIIIERYIVNKWWEEN